MFEAVFLKVFEAKDVKNIDFLEGGILMAGNECDLNLLKDELEYGVIDGLA